MTSEKPELTETVNAQMPFGATLGIRTFGDADEVDATLEFSPDLSAQREVRCTGACS